jgi:hypothetical protein
VTILRVPVGKLCAEFDFEWMEKNAVFLKSKSGVVVPGQPGSQILLSHQKYWLPITNIFDEQQQQIVWSVFCGFMFENDAWQLLDRSCEAYVPGTLTTNF